LLLDGQMKIGHFAVAFEDLAVPMPGLSVTVTRTTTASARTVRTLVSAGI
jgi:hypothetical protein